MVRNPYGNICLTLRIPICEVYTIKGIVDIITGRIEQMRYKKMFN